MSIFLAKVTKVGDDESRGTNRKMFVIRFDAKGIIEDATAYPVGVPDQPEVGEEVLVFELETVFGYCYMYQKVKTEDNTRFRIGGNLIDIREDGIDVECRNGSSITISADGDLDISSGKGLSISVKGDADINVGGRCTLSAKTTSFPNGSVAPSGSGPFCAIPICPYTGQPHVGNTLMAT